MSRYLLIIFVAVAILLYLTSAPDGDGNAPLPGIAVQNVKQARLAELAVAFANTRVHATCGDVGDIRETKRSTADAAETLVRTMTSLQASAPGAARGSRVTYALGRPTKGWQVVVLAREGELVIASYGLDLELPVESVRIPCR